MRDAVRNAVGWTPTTRTVGASIVPPGRLLRGRLRWERAYARRLLLTDVFVLLVAAIVAYLYRFGSGSASLTVLRGSVDYRLVGLVLVCSWIALLAAFRSRHLRVAVTGSAEYQRVVRAAVVLFGWVCVLVLVLGVEPSRVYLGLFVVGGLGGTVAGRWVWRRWLGQRRREGRFRYGLFVIGGLESATSLASRLETESELGYRVIGVWVPDGRMQGGTLEVNGRAVPVYGASNDIIELVEGLQADTIAVTGTEHLKREGLCTLESALTRIAERRRRWIRPGVTGPMQNGDRED